MDFKIRESRKPQGAKRLAAERTAYFQLVKQGFSNNQACRIVGIDPPTSTSPTSARVKYCVITSIEAPIPAAW